MSSRMQGRPIAVVTISECYSVPYLRSCVKDFAGAVGITTADTHPEAREWLLSQLSGNHSGVIWPAFLPVICDSSSRGRLFTPLRYSQSLGTSSGNLSISV